MVLSDDDYNHHSTYYGLYSAVQARRICELLDGMDVRYEFVRGQEDEKILKNWMAWDPTASNPHEGHELFVHEEDLVEVGDKIVELLKT